jgi:ribosomal protein S18 acetylase RimI-like enzyme
MNPLIADPRILPVREADLPELIALARDIWYKHYPAIVSIEQIEYMLAQRYHPDVIREQLASREAWWDKLSIGAQMVGFSACEVGADPSELKLDKLYVSYELRGRGLGSLLLRHIAQRAREAGFRAVYLQVNKNNHSAIRAYERNGFSIREAAQFDIGNGFIMDDFVMAKPLSGTARS